MAQFSLYRTSWCGFCARVERRIADLGIEVELRDIDTDADARRDLQAATGRETVPCLRIDDSTGAPRWLHESAAIIEFLEESA
ncbi:MAG: glutaredoxin [Myxococcota bacterium]|nr:glutaredoxin [Myxococcota bacterium]